VLLVSDGFAIDCTLRVSGSDEAAELTLIIVYLEWCRNHLKLDRVHFVLIKLRKLSDSGVHALNSRPITEESTIFVLYYDHMRTL
jgi:hypothetical protein